MDKLKGYNFDCCCDTKDTTSSIIESRLVPRDLSNFDNWTSNKGASYVYVDVDGKPKKLSVEYILANGIEIVKQEPKDADPGTIIFEEI